jgi:hypothetical protein
LTDFFSLLFELLSNGNAILEAQILPIRILRVAILLYREFTIPVVSHVSRVVVSAYMAYDRLRLVDEEPADSLLVVWFDCAEAVWTQFGFSVFWEGFASVALPMLTFSDGA